jgi:hypothetical protein
MAASVAPASDTPYPVEADGATRAAAVLSAWCEAWPERAPRRLMGLAWFTAVVAVSAGVTDAARQDAGVSRLVVPEARRPCADDVPRVRARAGTVGTGR